MKRTRKLMPLGTTEDGHLAAKICESHDPDEVGNVAVCVKVPTGKTLGTDLGTLTPSDDGHIEFKSFDTEGEEPIEVEDHTKAQGRGSKGPAKVASRAFRDGWERTFKN